MNRSSIKIVLSFMWCIVLIAAMALNITGCGNKQDPSETVTTTPQVSSTEGADEVQYTVLGEGSVVFYFVAVDLDGKETKFEIHTDATMVGEALLDNDLIAGEQGDYGLYIKTVNGLTLDWDQHGKYWSFEIDGEYALAGVDMTEIVAGTTYSLVPA